MGGTAYRSGRSQQLSPKALDVDTSRIVGKDDPAAAGDFAKESQAAASG